MYRKTEKKVEETDFGAGASSGPNENRKRRV